MNLDPDKCIEVGSMLLIFGLALKILAVILRNNNH